MVLIEPDGSFTVNRKHLLLGLLRVPVALAPGVPSTYSLETSLYKLAANADGTDPHVPYETFLQSRIVDLATCRDALELADFKQGKKRYQLL